MSLKNLSYKIRQAAAALADEPTQEMKDYFEERTKKHIDRVNANIKKIQQNFPQYDYTYDHDKSKFSGEEKLPYIWMTEFYRTNKKLKYPEGMQEKIDKAVEHHYKSNSHHPEYYGSAAEMSKKDLIEMVCDWAAMGQEMGDSLKAWADKTVPKKNFTPEQKDFIYELIDIL